MLNQDSSMVIQWRNEKRKLRDLVPWEHNPREINRKEAERLGDSLAEFGQIQTIAIGPSDEILDGHQRKAVWSLLPQFGPDYEIDVRVASRALTDKERQKLVVYLHRGTTANWNWDELANTFEVPDLLEWGFKSYELGLVGDPDNPDDLWQGMPEFEQDDLTAVQTVNVHFRCREDVIAFAELVNQKITDKTKYIWYPEAEIRRFMDKRYIEQS